MTIVDMIKEEAGTRVTTVFAAATLAGVSNAMLLGLANHAAEHSETVDFRLLAMFVVAGLLYVISARQTHHRTTAIVEDALLRIKNRITRKLERAEAYGLENMGRSEIYDRITENIGMISDSAGQIANLMMSVLVLAAAALYVLWLSPEGFVFIALLIGSGMALFWNKRKVILDGLQEASAQRLVFFDALTDLVQGFRETKFSAKRSDEVVGEVVHGTKTLRDLTVRTHVLFDDNYIFTNVVLFTLLCVLTMILPQYLEFTPATIGALTATVLFAWNPIAGIAGGLPAYLRSNVALEQIATLEGKLDAIASEDAFGEAIQRPWPVQDYERPGQVFERLEVRGLEFKYPDGDEPGFRVGPLDLSIRAGEVIFLVGGNGSGKSTLFKALTGLYPAAAGQLIVDGVRVGKGNVAAYREMLSVIFTDFHLFTKLYGLLDADPQQAARLLDQMQLSAKTNFENQRFTNRALSTGQRKRLAMIVALLEDRPICAFDEWAADQDPEFRQYFYEELVPSLVARGKTVIAVSHDDRYFHCADQLITLDYGKVRSVVRQGDEPEASQPSQPPSAPTP